MAGCHSFCLIFIFFFYNIHSFIHSITFIQYIYHLHSLGPLFISSSLESSVEENGAESGAEPRIELGPALQQADALPTEPRRTILVFFAFAESDLHFLCEVEKNCLVWTFNSKIPRSSSNDRNFEFLKSSEIVDHSCQRKTSCRTDPLTIFGSKFAFQ